MASMNTRLNIKKLDGNIVQKHGDSKQVGFKQLGPGVETGVHGVHDEKRVWFEVELQGAQGDREAEVFQVSNNDTSGAQRRLKDKQPEEKTNTDCLVKKPKKNIRLGERSRRVFWAEDTTISTYLVNRSPSSAIGFKKPIDMLWFFGWLASINQGMLEPVKVKEEKKTFIGFGVGTGSMHVLHGFEFEVEPLGDHTFEVEPHRIVDHVVGSQEMCMCSAMVAGNAVTTAMAITEGIHQAIKGLLDKAKGNVLGMEIVRDRSSNTLRVSRSMFYNLKLVQTLLEGHSILSLEGSLSGDCDVEKNGKWSCMYAVGSQEYQMVCTRLNIASVDVGYGSMILGCVGSLKANLQHMEALSTTNAGYMTFTKAWKKKIWLKGLLTKSRYELSLVACIATGALVKGGSRSEVPTHVEVAVYRDEYFILKENLNTHFKKNKNHLPPLFWDLHLCLSNFLLFSPSLSREMMKVTSDELPYEKNKNQQQQGITFRSTSKTLILVTLTLIILTVVPLYYPLHRYPTTNASTSDTNISQVYHPQDEVITINDNHHKCDVFSGEWVPNPDAPYYDNMTCWAIHEHQNCQKYGRPDSDFMKWRWQPDGCDLPIFNPYQFLELVRDKSLAFVGDSVGRNQMQSLICMLSRVEYPIDKLETKDENFKH
nr:protein trichome birefringence-like 19 [Tanacetum cinerariifolium]